MIETTTRNLNFHLFKLINPNLTRQNPNFANYTPPTIKHGRLPFLNWTRFNENLKGPSI